MIKYPSIEQFRNVVRRVRELHDFQGKDENGEPIYRHTSNYPTLKFQGTVKLHGSNGGIVRYPDRIEFQSRERVLTITEDNQGFMATMLSKNLDKLFSRFEATSTVAIYGEWCGTGIQKGVAISTLPKMFVIFGVKVNGEWVTLPQDLHDNDNGIYNVLQFPTYEVEIDFNRPELVQNHLIELTTEVENECPAGKFFGVSGIGEGIVFTCVDNHDLMFKSKGEKHSVSKVKVINSIDTEALASINEFVESTVTEARLEQGLSFFRENNIEVKPSNTGEFLRWVVTDVLKEELDTITSNGLNEKQVKAAIVTKSRQWFLNHA